MDNIEVQVEIQNEKDVESRPKHTTQTINFDGAEDRQGIEITGEDVIINCSDGTHNHGSSKVKLTNIVDYNWESRLYMGQLIAVHMSGKYIAYGIKVQKTSQNLGLVRVASRESEQRALLRGMNGQIQDISFAYSPSQYILGCVDEDGSLFVHNIESDGDEIVCTLVLHVIHTPDPSVAPFHRVLWCPYMPEEDPSEDIAKSSDVDKLIEDEGAKLLVLTQGCTAEMWHVGQVSEIYGPGPHKPRANMKGFLEINEHQLPIIDAAFSPDGTALATASLDGVVKFFQVYMHDDAQPRCLHQWKPHGGKAVSCLFFLDDHQNFIPDVQFWKFAITGCDNNSEIKVWSCESWTCLQKILFKPEIPRKLFLKAGLDNTSGYLILSDIQNRLLYALQIHKDIKQSTAKIQHVSEFFLQSPILSYGIVDAGVRKLKCSASTEDLYHIQDDLEDGANFVAVIIRMYIVQPKSLQECRIVYQPDYSSSNSVASLKSDTVFQDGISEMDTKSDPDEPVKPTVDLSEVLNPPLNLMTPDSFSSPRRESLDNTVPLIPQQTPEAVVPICLEKESVVEPVISTADDMINFGQRATKENFASGGSSPSREVQEILDAINSFPDEDYYEIVENDIESKCLRGGGSSKDEVVTTENEDSDPPNNETYTNNANDKLLEGDEWPEIPILKVEDVIKNEVNRINTIPIPPQPDTEPSHINAFRSYADLVNSQGSKENDYSNKMIPEKLKSEVNPIEADPLYSKPLKSFSELLNILPNTSIESDVSNKIVTEKLYCLEEQLQQQQILLKDIYCQLTEMDRKHTPAETNHTQLKNVLANQIDSMFTRNLTDQSKMFESWMITRSNKEREYQETLMTTVSQVIGNNIVDKLDKVVASEIQKHIIPQILSSLEPLKRQLHSEMVQKLTTTDHLLKENITKLVNSKAVMDVIANSVVTALKPHIENSFKETLSSSLLPSWERVCQSMFLQMHDIFTQGTKEYTASLETHLEKQRKTQDKGRDIVSHLQTVSDSMRTNSEHLANSLSNEIQQQIQKTFVTFQESMKKTVRQEVKDQIDRAFKNHAASIEDSVLNAVKSRAVTPSPHLIDSHVQQAQIQQLLAQGQINAAFQQALSASDLSLVVYTCEKVNPQQIFGEAVCPLQQNVLLSLIQQLGADMTNHTEIKCKYLEEAVMNLQTSNPLTREHMPIVLKELQCQLTAFISGNPNNKLTKKMKMLLMATQSLIQ